MIKKKRGDEDTEGRRRWRGEKAKSNKEMMRWEGRNRVMWCALVCASFKVSAAVFIKVSDSGGCEVLAWRCTYASRHQVKFAARTGSCLSSHLVLFINLKKKTTKKNKPKTINLKLCLLVV